MRRARSVDEYVEMIRSALVEVEELRAAFEWDLEDMSRLPGFIEPLEQSLHALLEEMEAGEYAWADGELAFMRLVRREGPQIPFADLLTSINETHTKGLDVDG